MHQVLLVDDEPLVHHDLWTLTDLRKYGFELCGEAYSGDMALEMIEQSPPHIAIIDVNMPGMNGVELNRTIKARYPSIKTIMLSSYDDYDYVRDCLRNGAVDYLLKHRLDGDALIAVLNKAALELQQEDQVQADQQWTEKLSPASIREQIADLAKGKAGTALELESHVLAGRLYPGAVGYVAAVVQLIPFLLLTESFTDVQTNRFVQQAVEIMQQSLGDIRERTAAYVENGRLVVVFSFTERSEHAAISEAGRQISKMQHALELFLNLKCIFAVGHVCNSLSQLEASCGYAERKLDQMNGAGASDANEREPLTIEEQKQLLLAIERLDQEGTHQLLAQVFTALRHHPVHSYKVQTAISELLKIGDKAWKKRIPASSSEAEAGILPSRGDLGRIGSMEELQQWLQNYYSELLKLLQHRRTEGSYSRHVSLAIHLILEKYREGITLEQAAGEIGLNPSYLSRIFKEEMHVNFSEYLNRVRIDASRKLLESGRYSIKEISSQVGFSTYNYFFKVFKELTGKTPHAYVTSLGQGPITVKYVE